MPPEKQSINRGGGDLDRIRLCAANNADLYKSVFSAHALVGQGSDKFWSCDDIALPYYSSLVTLDPDAVVEQLAEIERLKAILAGPFAVKDGFHKLDLSQQGFKLLIPATWIWAEPKSSSRAPLAPGWVRVDSSTALEEWEMAWGEGGSPCDQRVFPPSILHDENVAIFGRAASNGFDGGCIANRSPTVVGISNIFNLAGAPPVAKEAVQAAASAFGGGLPFGRIRGR